MQEVGQNSGSHIREGGQEGLEVHLQVLLPLLYQASWVLSNYLFGWKESSVNFLLCNKLQENTSTSTADQVALYGCKPQAGTDHIFYNHSWQQCQGECSQLGHLECSLFQSKWYWKYQYNSKWESPSLVFGDIGKSSAYGPLKFKNQRSLCCISVSL